MIKVTIYMPEQISDEKLEFAVISAKYQGKWIFCRHRSRTTWEIPGGHREKGESIEACARRELFEETGARIFTLNRLCVYSAESEHGIGYGMLYFADVTELGELPPEFEIAEIQLFDSQPSNLTYPAIQGHLYYYVQSWLDQKESNKEGDIT